MRIEFAAHGVIEKGGHESCVTSDHHAPSGRGASLRNLLDYLGNLDGAEFRATPYFWHRDAEYAGFAHACDNLARKRSRLLYLVRLFSQEPVERARIRVDVGYTHARAGLRTGAARLNVCHWNTR